MIRQHVSGAVVAVLVVVAYGLIAEDQPIVSYTRNYSTLDVRAGDIVQVDAVVVRDKECSSTVQRDWIDPDGNLLVSNLQEYPTVMSGGEERYAGQVVIPLNASPGPLRQRVKVTFFCNWLQRLTGIGSDFILPDVIFHVRP